MTSPDERIMREQVNALDDSIIHLLHERAVISRRLQERRIRSGGTRVDLSRERDVIANYVAILGHGGADVATTVMGFCKGMVVDVEGERTGAALPRHAAAGTPVR